MKNLLIALILLSCSSAAFAQKFNLSKELWNRVETCNSTLEDMDDDGKKDYEELIDDSKNGYLKIGGSFPTCGCECYSTVGAFKTAKGEYVFLNENTWSCGWTHEITSNRKITELLPRDLNESLLGRNRELEDYDRAYFYLDIEIPRYGTDTKVEVKMIPFGMKMGKEIGLISSIYKEEDHIDCYGAYQLEMLAMDATEKETIDYLMNGEYEQICAEDQEIIGHIIRKNDYDMSRFESYEAIGDQLSIFKSAYDLYMGMNFTSAVLGWDKAKEQFYIKSTEGKPQQITFIEFLQTSIYWMALC